MRAHARHAFRRILDWSNLGPPHRNRLRVWEGRCAWMTWLAYVGANDGILVRQGSLRLITSVQNQIISTCALAHPFKNPISTSGNEIANKNCGRPPVMVSIGREWVLGFPPIVNAFSNWGGYLLRSMADAVATGGVNWYNCIIRVLLTPRFAERNG